MEQEHPIDRAAGIVGSAVALATILGVSKAALSQWKLPGRKVPAEHCPAIERATARAVQCEELRPDIDWAYLRLHVAPTAEQEVA
ncbi:hypothetical protein GCM10023144_01490 [Pigmentiphaga soli]|uniref:Cro/Cl family transcriptional regulator n=1 Tax=Pigmentiphaga soli TaxID=1007095 RepID=A0ABP8GD83_9BURK